MTAGVGFGNFGSASNFAGLSNFGSSASRPVSTGAKLSANPSYDEWAAYETQRLNPMSSGAYQTLINPTQYYNALAGMNSSKALASGGNLAAAGAAAAKIADPWASQRGQYQTMLSQLVKSPGSAMQNNPFFKWQQNQGLDAVNRKMAASGGRVSGNRMMALSDYAQNQSGQNFFQLADLYSLLGGAKNQNPEAAAALQYRGAMDQANMQARIGGGGGGGYSTDIDMAGFRPGYFV